MARPMFLIIAAVLTAGPLHAQPTAALQGRVLDMSGGVIGGATVRARNNATGLDHIVASDKEGRYYLAALAAGSYNVSASAGGFKSAVIATLTLEVGRSIVRDFHLSVGETTEFVVVGTEAPLIDRTSSTIGHVVSGQAVQEIPLNGRNFVDLALLAPGSVAPSQSGFSSTPNRGLGSLAFNTSGNREEAVAFVVNGVASNNLTFGSLGFRLPLASIQELKIDYSAFSTEFGHVSGAVVNLVTRSGSDTLHGEVYEFFRDDALDARGYFEVRRDRPREFGRHQFGGVVGGPFVRGRVFFLGTFDGLRQRQDLDLNSLVLSDEQRAAATSPVVRRLIDFIPRANARDGEGTPRFIGSAAAVVDSDVWTGDVRARIGSRDDLQVFYAYRRVNTREPASFGTTVPGFGHTFATDSSLLTARHVRVLGSGLVNEARFGRTHVDGGGMPSAALNPADVGIRNGVTRPIGLPQLSVAGGLVLGGPAVFPTGRNDTSYVLANTLRYVRGAHAVALGGEYGHFINENFAEGTGSFNFPTVDGFLAGTANALAITLGERRSLIDQRALGLFVQDQLTISPAITLDLGLRYEWHVTPTERNNQFIVFDATTASLLRVGVDIGEIYRQNNLNLEPQVGVAWSPSHDGRFVVRAAYRRAIDQPGTTAVTETAANPPSATPLTAAGSIPIDDAIERTRAAGLAPTTVDPAFSNASLDSWNVNLQYEIASNLAITAGHLGSRGRDLRITRNLNQPVDGARPYAAVSPSSPILPGVTLGNITQVESTGFSSYHALWLSATRRLGGGLQFDASYTWSRSLDTNSLNSSGFAVQNSYDIANQYGLSDFNATHRFVLSGVYQTPAMRQAWLRGWQLASVVQIQSGNPVNIVTSNSTLNGTPNTVRPDVNGPIRIIGDVDQWFDPSVFTAVDRFGTLGRNRVIGPGFRNVDLAVMRTFRLKGALTMQARAEMFNVFNWVNLGPPGNIVGTPTFARITRTRLPTGESGSSRQIQLAAKLTF